MSRRQISLLATVLFALVCLAPGTVALGAHPSPVQGLPPRPTLKPIPTSTPSGLPVILYFVADRAQIVAGESVRIRYHVEGADRVFLDGRGVECPGEKRKRLDQTHTFKLAAVNDMGKTEESLTVEVLQPTETPLPTPIPTATPTPTPTPTIALPLTVIAADLPSPLPTPVTSTIRPIAINLIVYYDENNNKQPDPGEGVNGAGVSILDGPTNETLGQAYTNPNGHTRIAVLAPSQVVVSVPLLTYSEPVTGDASIALRIRPWPRPVRIP